MCTLPNGEKYKWPTEEKIMADTKNEQVCVDELCKDIHNIIEEIEVGI